MKTGAAQRLDPSSQHPTAEEFLEEIRQIFNSGTLRGAREVAERGLALYPDHPELRRLHYALRPFEVRVSTDPNHKMFDPTPSYEWLKKNAHAYRGKWVGLQNGELVAAADSLEEVLQAFGDRDPRGSLIHHILD
ncbi:MAG TPA: DUF5678 domain-containing protein [Thermoanaerobaculia bacterium]|jgi:hypothetical protein